MKYKYRKLILKLYFYRYLKYCLNPVKFNFYYQLITFISKILLFEIGKPIIFLKKRYYNYKYYSGVPFTDREKKTMDLKEQQQIINLGTVLTIHINTREEKITYSNFIYVIITFLQSLNLAHCDKQLILNHPTLPDRIKKLMVDIPYFKKIDYIEYDYDLVSPDEKVPTDFYINNYFDFNDPKDKKLLLNWALFEHNRHVNTFIFFPFFHFYYILLEENKQSSFYIDIYKNQVHLEMIKLIKFFYTYSKLIAILIAVNILFGFTAVKLLLSLFLLIGFILLIRARLFITAIKRVWILFLFSLGYSFLNLSISIPLLNLIVSFLILKVIYFLVVNIGSISYKLNYPKYTFINWLYKRYWIKLEGFFRNKIFDYKFYKKNKNILLAYQKILSWLESIKKKEENLLKAKQ